MERNKKFGLMKIIELTIKAMGFLKKINLILVREQCPR